MLNSFLRVLKRNRNTQIPAVRENIKNSYNNLGKQLEKTVKRSKGNLLKEDTRVTSKHVKSGSASSAVREMKRQNRSKRPLHAQLDGGTEKATQKQVWWEAGNEELYTP